MSGLFVDMERWNKFRGWLVEKDKFNKFLYYVVSCYKYSRCSDYFRFEIKSIVNEYESETGKSAKFLFCGRLLK